ncbi:flagellar protein FlaI [Rhodovibrio salinarum]|uniref:Flagellar protein FlaI n=2 Tax=Rhodovibrio salinarum TaxID=1087 RepID=A0A934UYY9_9PROT|nr:flagellar protein FlaI [Rhodovibrio salinarum]
MLSQRNVVTDVLNALLAETKAATQQAHGTTPPAPPAAPVPDTTAEPEANDDAPKNGRSKPNRLRAAKQTVQPFVMERIDVAVASSLEPAELERQIGEMIGEVLIEQKVQLNRNEQKQLCRLLLNDMLGLGPLEPLLADETVTDIMVNGPNQVYVERGGKLELTDVEFRDNAHVMNIATRIVTRVGRRIDESSPLVDARLEDGSRVNIIAPPLAIDGASISIRKFAKKKITLEVMARQNNVSEPLANVLKIAARCQLNVLISGGTGSGKTTLLNAMSRLIDHGERIVTIEDAAELQLQQPHVVRLETRPPSLEGLGEITMRDLVKNALRMRPDRIILGEIRGAEAMDMLQAMNTGHDGSMCTLHANSPREALTRLENMVAMSGFKLPAKAVRTQISDAVNLIVQISRMRDGKRRISKVSEVVGMEGDVITTQDLFAFEFQGEGPDGQLTGSFRSSGLRPYFTTRAEYFGLADKLLDAMGCNREAPGQ